jgi:hypothetical protein
MMADYYIMSSRGFWKVPGQVAAAEFEDALVECCNGTLISPTMPEGSPRQRALTRHSLAQSLGASGAEIAHERKQLGAKGLIGRFRSPLQTEIPPRRSSDEQVLIVVGNNLRFTVALLSSIPDRRARFDIICAYITDAFPYESEASKASWKRRLSPFNQTLSSLDHIFSPIGSTMASLSDIYGVPVSMIPMACDVVKYGNGELDRPIDLMGYGRQHVAHSKAFADTYNDPKSDRFYYHTDHMQISSILDFDRYRRFFWKTLCRSRVALAYDPLAVNPAGHFPCSFVSLRWFESVAAGCLVVGRRPTCPEMDELFFWEDSTLEIPEGTDDALAFIEELLADKPRTEAAHRRNYAHSLAHHDWRYRVASMLDQLKLPYPDRLQRELDSLRERCQKLMPVCV